MIILPTTLDIEGLKIGLKYDSFNTKQRAELQDRDRSVAD